MGKDIFTDRFIIRPIGRWEMAKQVNRALGIKEVSESFARSYRKPRFLRTLRRYRRSNHRTRFYHAIIDRESGQVIGTHGSYYIPVRIMTVEVILSDLSWWGKEVVAEVRGALIAAYLESGRVDQVTCSINSRNFGSLINASKLGFELVGVNYMSMFEEIENAPADYLSFSLRGDALKKYAKASKSEAADDAH